MKYLSCLIIVFGAITAVAQQLPDTMQARLDAMPDDSMKMVHMRDLSVSFEGTNRVYAILISQQRLVLVQKLKLPLGIASAHNELGNYFGAIGNYSQSLHHHFESLKVARQIPFPKGIAASLNNIANVYQLQNNNRDALNYYFEALAMNRESGNTLWISMNLSNIGLAYNRLGVNDSALYFLRQAAGLHKEVSDSDGLIIAYMNIGLAFQDEGLMDSARAIYDAAMAISNAYRDDYLRAELLTHFGSFHNELSNFDSAGYYFTEALELSQAIGAREAERVAWEGLAKVYEHQGNYAQALKAFRAYSALEDSLRNAEITSKMANLKLDLELTKKDEQIALINESKRLQSLVLYGTVALVVLLVIMTFVLFSRYRIKKRSNDRMARLNSELQRALDDLKSTQEQLVRQEKLASLGQLTAGIAHEIQNPLNFVNNFSEVSAEMLDELKAASNDGERNALVETVRQNVTKIAEHGRRADGIIKSMLLHSHSGTGERQPTNLNSLCSDYLNLSYHGIKATHEGFTCSLKTHFDDSLPKVNVVPQDIGRVLLNLFNNAFQAVQQRQAEEDGKYQPVVEVHTQRNGNSTVITVRDNGGGIPEEIRAKIFEPFFTTKRSGVGTGLGLSISYDIVKAHGGELQLVERDGDGTEFKVVLPL